MCLCTVICFTNPPLSILTFKERTKALSVSMIYDASDDRDYLGKPDHERCSRLQILRYHKIVKSGTL